MNADLMHQRDAVLTWLQTASPGTRPLAELVGEYDAWARQHQAPLVGRNQRLGRHLAALDLEQHRTKRGRGYVVTAPSLHGRASASLRMAFMFARAAVAGPWVREQVWPTYVRWLQDHELDLRPLSESWLLHALQLHGLPVTDTHVMFPGRPS